MPPPSSSGIVTPQYAKSHSSSWLKVRLETLTARQTWAVVLSPYLILLVAIALDFGGDWVKWWAHMSDPIVLPGGGLCVGQWVDPHGCTRWGDDDDDNSNNGTGTAPLHYSALWSIDVSGIPSAAGHLALTANWRAEPVNTTATTTMVAEPLGTLSVSARVDGLGSDDRHSAESWVTVLDSHTTSFDLRCSADACEPMSVFDLFRDGLGGGGGFSTYRIALGFDLSDASGGRVPLPAMVASRSSTYSLTYSRPWYHITDTVLRAALLFFSLCWFTRWHFLVFTFRRPPSPFAKADVDDLSLFSESGFRRWSRLFSSHWWLALPERPIISLLLVALLLWQSPGFVVSQWFSVVGEGVRLTSGICLVLGEQLMCLACVLLVDSLRVDHRSSALRKPPGARGIDGSINSWAAKAADRSSLAQSQQFQYSEPKVRLTPWLPNPSSAPRRQDSSSSRQWWEYSGGLASSASASAASKEASKPPSPTTSSLSSATSASSSKKWFCGSSRMHSKREVALRASLIFAVSVAVGVLLVCLRYPRTAGMCGGTLCDDTNGALTETGSAFFFASCIGKVIFDVFWVYYIVRACWRTAAALRCCPFAVSRHQQLCFRVVVLQVIMLGLYLCFGGAIHLWQKVVEPLVAASASHDGHFSAWLQEVARHEAGSLGGWATSLYLTPGRLLIVWFVVWILALLYLPPVFDAASTKSRFLRQCVRMERELPMLCSVPLLPLQLANDFAHRDGILRESGTGGRAVSDLLRRLRQTMALNSLREQRQYRYAPMPNSRTPAIAATSGAAASLNSAIAAVSSTADYSGLQFEPNAAWWNGHWFAHAFCLETACMLLEASWQAYYSLKFRENTTADDGVNSKRRRRARNNDGRSSAELEEEGREEDDEDDEECDILDADVDVDGDEAGALNWGHMDLNQCRLRLVERGFIQRKSTDTCLIVAEPISDPETDDRIVVAFRGTASLSNIVTDLKFRQRPMPDVLLSAKRMQSLVSMLLVGGDEGEQKRPRVSSFDAAVSPTKPKDPGPACSAAETNASIRVASATVPTPTVPPVQWEVVEPPGGKDVGDGGAPPPAVVSAHSLSVAKSLGGKPMVHSGFWTAYETVRSEMWRVLLAVIKQRAQRHRHKHARDSVSVPPTLPIYVTGHSLGGALADLASYDLAVNLAHAAKLACGRTLSLCVAGAQQAPARLPSLLLHTAVASYTFGSPRVGNSAWARRFDKEVRHAYRVCMDGDPVVSVPPPLLGLWKHSGVHVLVEHVRETGSPTDASVALTGSNNIIVAPTAVETAFRRKKATGMAHHSMEVYRESMEACFSPDELQKYLRHQQEHSHASGCPVPRTDYGSMSSLPGWLTGPRQGALL